MTPRPRGLGPGIGALQRAAGNRAVAQLARSPKHHKQQPAPDPRIDYDDASAAITDWFADWSNVLALRTDAEREAIKNYEKFTELKDPPDLSNALIGTIFNAIADMIPGGSLIKSAITAGLFAHDLASLKRDLARNDIEVPEDLGAAGPGKEHAERGEKVYGAYEKGHKLGEGAVKIKEAVDQVKEAQAAAKEAEERAHEMAELGVKRLNRWEDAVAALTKQRDAARSWLRQAWDGGRRGGLAPLVHRYLGDAPKLEGGAEGVTSKLARAWELTLYRAKYGDIQYYRQTTQWRSGQVDVDESYFTTGEEYVHQHGYVRYSGITQALRRRVAELAGRPDAAGDDQAIAQILGMTTITQTDKEDRDKPDYDKLQQQYGRRRVGEV